MISKTIEHSGEHVLIVSRRVVRNSRYSILGRRFHPCHGIGVPIGLRQKYGLEKFENKSNNSL
jgi:hypothetical protein